MRRILGILIGGAVFLACATTVLADERFSVEVDVDVTDKNASVARERAMNEAHRAAIVEVAKRITSAEGADRLRAMNDNQLINFIKEVSVNSEKSSSVRYIASLKVVLNEDMLKTYMAERQIPLLAAGGTRILVVPVFRAFSSDRPLLWESSNRWRQAWERAPKGSVVRFVSLPSNATNYSIIDAPRALATDSVALDKLMRINGVDDVYVLDAMYDGIDGLVVHATSYKGDKQTIRVSGAQSEDDALFDRGVDMVQQNIEQKSKQQALEEGGRENVLVAMYSFNRLSDWVRLENVLRNISSVRSIEIQALGADKAQFKISFIGNYEKLVYDLREKAYNLSERGDFAVIEEVR